MEWNSFPKTSVLSQSSGKGGRIPNQTAPSSLTNSSQLSLIDEQKEENKIIKNSVLPISTEYDMIREKYFIKDGQDRSQWYARFLKENKEAKGFIERVDPVSRASSFARLYLPQNRMISQSLLLSLISQHFRTLGLIDSQSSLHEEWSEPLEAPPYLLRSQLNLIVQRGINNAEKFWEYSLPSAANHENASEILDKEISKTIGGTPLSQKIQPPFRKRRKETRGS